MQSWVERWMGFHALLLLVFTLSFYFIDLLPYLAIPISASFLFFFIWNAYRQKSLIFLIQPANLITTFRLCLLLYFCWAYPSIPVLHLGLLALLVLCMDGLDGFLARKYQTVSLFGEYLDMETDAFYVLCLSVILYELNYFGAWILMVGLLRYGYFLLLRNTKAPEQKETRIFQARLIAVILMATLAACFLLPSFLHRPAMGIATLLVFYSFGNSFWLVVKNGD